MRRSVVTSVVIMLMAGLVVGASTGAFARTTRHFATAAITAVTPDHGPLGGGTIVNIKGRNLVSATAVQFGSTSASFVPRSRHLVQATAPAGSGTVDIRVTTNTGTSPIVTADRFTYVNTPVIQSVRPKVGSSAGGNRVTISGAGFSSVTQVDFGSASATSFMVDSPNAITAISPAHAVGTVDVTVTVVGGTTSPIDQADQYTYVKRVPAVTSVVFDVGNQAGGDQVTITGQLFSSPATVDFGSTPASNVTVKNATTIQAVSPPGTGIVEVTVTTTKGTSVVNPPVDDFEYTATGP